MAAKEMIEVGSRWIIGNGGKVNIWCEKWLPLPDSFKVLSPQKHNTGVVKVTQLIDKETSTWKAELIREIFLPHEADNILSRAVHGSGQVGSGLVLTRNRPD